MAFYRCGGGSGEVHGATITITCDDGIGQTCNLTLGTETVDSKVIGSGGSVYFEEILEIGTYTAKVTIDGTEYTADVIITAENVVNKENVSAEIAMKVYLYNEGDECTDLTGGWASDTNCTLTKTDSYMRMTPKSSVSSFYIKTDSNPMLTNKFKVGQTIHIILNMKYSSANRMVRVYGFKDTTMTGLITENITIPNTDGQVELSSALINADSLAQLNKIIIEPFYSTSQTFYNFETYDVEKIWLE